MINSGQMDQDGPDEGFGPDDQSGPEDQFGPNEEFGPNDEFGPENQFGPNDGFESRQFEDTFSFSRGFGFDNDESYEFDWNDEVNNEFFGEDQYLGERWADFGGMSDYEEGGMMSAYAVGGGEMEADILRNDYLSDIDMYETQSYFEEIGIDDVFFSIREFIQFENAAALQEGATGLRFTSVFEFFVPENTSNSTFFKVAGAQGPLTFSFDPAFEGNDDRALFELNSTTGEFRFIDPPDFERPLDRSGNSSYGVELLVTDGVSELRGFKEVIVQNLAAPPDNVFSSEIAFVNPSDVGDLLLTDWAQFFVLTQDGILTWDVSGTFPSCL